MAGYDTTAFGAMLKILYGDTIADAVFSRTWLLDRFSDSDTVEFAGSQYLWPVDVLPNLSYGVNLMDGGVLPATSARTTVPASTQPVNHASATDVTDETIQRSKTDQGAFERAVKKCVNDVEKDLPKRVNAALYGPVLPFVTANSAGTTITLDGVQYLRVGDVIAIGNRTTGAVTGTRTITARSIATGVITVDTAITVALATDGVWYPNAGPVDRRIEGLRQITGTGRTLHNINSTTYPAWDGNAVPMSGAEVGEQTYISLISRIMEREVGVPTEGVTSYGMRDNLAKDFLSQKRFTDAHAVEFKAGYSGIVVNGEVPIIGDSDCPKGYAFLFDPKAIKRVKMGEPGWMQAGATDGDVFTPVIDQATARPTSRYRATYRMYIQLVAEMPGATGVITGGADTLPVN